jgi:uncharacterized repeat protein (TIGR02543 family)
MDAPAADKVSDGVSRAAQSTGMPSVFISDPQQPEKEPVEVRPDPVSGEFEAKGFIPGEALLASVGIGDLPPIPIPGIPIPPDDPEYEPPVTPIPVVSDGVNLKVSIRPVDESVDTTLLYANGLSMEFLLEVENIGNEDCTAATYEIDYDDTYLAVNDPAKNNRLGTLTPKEQGGTTYKKTIPLTITPKPLSGNLALVDAEIGVKINDTIVKKTWNDSVSIRYNRAKIPFRFRSEYPVQGIIKVPGGKTHHFRTSGSSYGDYTYNIELPWSTEEYFIIFSGATAETEAAYSLGINTAPSGDFITFNEPGIYEPNDGEEDAVLIENSDSIMAYLHGGSRTDIDYYRINMGNEVPVIKLVPLESYAFLENGGNGDGTINPGESAYLDLLVKNETNQSRSVTVSLSAEGANAGYVTIEKGSASTPAIRPNYYASLTGSADSPTGNAGLFVTDRISQALEVSVSPECPADISIPFVLSFTDSLGISWTETVSLAVLEPDRSVAIAVPAAGNCVLTGRTGNGDSQVQPGESFYYDITVKNSGDRSVPGLHGALGSTASGGNVTIVTALADLGTLSPGASRTARYEFTVNENCPPGTEIAFTLTLTSQNGRTWWDSPSSVTVKARGKVAFDADGGEPAAQIRTAGLDGTIGSSNMPVEPARSGYAFGGWYTEQNGGGDEFTASTPVRADITVYAKWTILYTVIFDADGGNPEMQTRAVLSGGTVGSSNIPAEPARNGHVFGGWYTERNGGGSQFTASATVSANTTVYAKWIIVHTVSFDADGGSPASQTRTVVNGSTLDSSNMPTEPSRSNYAFGGWYTSSGGNGNEFTASTSISADITVYAKWTIPSNLSLNEALTWLSTYAVEGGVYTITIKNDETIPPRALSYGNKNVSFTLVGGASERTISLSAKGSLFTVGSGVTLTLGSNVTLQGQSSNTASLVTVDSGGTLVMNTGSKINGNSGGDYYGGGVYVSGTFMMNGGEISGNYASRGFGGGVYVSDGAFTMNGGEISGNTVVSSYSYSSSSYGGGVYVSGGTFTMNGGEISGNTASCNIIGSSSFASYGGGVCVDGTFTMNGGGIISNIVYSYSSRDSSRSYGGGVYVSGTFIMKGGEISGNTYSGYSNYSNGGGAFVSGTFTMSGGEIRGNTAYSSGGGVYVDGTFTKQSGGIIYGSDATSAAFRNTAGSGDAVVVADPNYPRIRDTTAGIGVTLDSSKEGSTGGWE